MPALSAFRHALAGLVLTAGLGLQAHAADVEGVKLDDSVRVAGKELRLNGAGVRTKVFFKVYVAALYLPEKRGSTAEVLATDGPRRVELVMMRDVSGSDLSESFVSALNANSDKAELAKVAAQTAKFSQVFSAIPGVKKGDRIVIDWVPGTGTLISLNGKPLLDPLPDVAFNNALLRIWLGDKPADSGLKPKLLGDRG